MVEWAKRNGGPRRRPRSNDATELAAGGSTPRANRRAATSGTEGSWRWVNGRADRRPDTTPPPTADPELHSRRAPRAILAAARSFDEALRAALVAVCRQRPMVLAHAVRAVEPRGALRPLGMLCGETSLDNAFLGNTLFRLEPPGTGLTRAAMRARAPVWVPSITEAPDFDRKDLLTHHGVKSGAGFPVVVQSEVAAVIELLYLDADAHDAVAATAASVTSALCRTAAKLWSP
jgi:hypothetical protein